MTHKAKHVALGHFTGLISELLQLYNMAIWRLVRLASVFGYKFHGAGFSMTLPSQCFCSLLSDRETYDVSISLQNHVSKRDNSTGKPNDLLHAFNWVFNSLLGNLLAWIAALRIGRFSTRSSPVFCLLVSSYVSLSITVCSSLAGLSLNIEHSSG